MAWWMQILVQVVPSIIQFLISFFQKKSSKIALNPADAATLADLKSMKVIADRIKERHGL